MVAVRTPRPPLSTARPSGPLRYPISTSDAVVPFDLGVPDVVVEPVAPASRGGSGAGAATPSRLSDAEPVAETPAETS